MEQQTTGTVSSNDSAQPSNVADGQQPTNGTAAQDMAQAPALQPKNNKKRNWIIATIVILLLIIGGASYYIISSNAASQEEMAYEVLENNDNPQDYRDFLEKYPNSEHANEVRQRLNTLEAMLSKWQSISLSDNVNDFINFKNTYSDIQYGRLCDIKIDSLDYITAQKLGTPEAFQRYLDAHPDGRYASEASIAQGTLRDQEVSDDERIQIMNIVTDFYNGFAAQDESKICTNIASTMKTFLHQHNASKATVLSTIQGMFNEHIQSVQFTVNRDFQIKKNSNGSYIATFSVDQHIERDNEGKTFGQYKCSAVIDPQLLITSLTMDEISRQ
ncbi:hypothetical protein [Prevotellamassilia timonensis]|uniref:hypothetical protein n=1 Tax=Prevotellamassilia timonensis TaxID=1852370 RepID=UPI0030773195